MATPPLNSINLKGHSEIRTWKDDVLFRRAFAEKIAQALVNWNFDRSLTIGLYGQWGEGKTSVLNMITEWIGNQDQNHDAVVLCFNPWEWSSQEALQRAFFDELGEKLAELTKGKRLDIWNDYVDRIQAYSSSVGSAGSIVQSIQGGTLALIGIIIGTTLPEEWKNIVICTCALIAVGLGIGRVSLDFAIARIVAREKHLARRGRTTLFDAKAKLRAALSGIRGNLIVIIDDIDRLPPDQMFMMLQLIKANGDFPRIVYLLAFQRDVVERGLQSARQVVGSQYLEKIIQVPIEMPIADSALVKKQLTNQLRDVVTHSLPKETFDWERWDVYFTSSLQLFFTTLRHVSRYIDAFAFHCAVLSVEGESEVDITDLAAVEALHVFVPDVYSIVGNNKGIFVSNTIFQMTSDERKASIQEKIAHLPPNRQDAVLELFKQLFPHVEGVYGPVDRPVPFHVVRYSDRRVCNPEVFDRYFTLTTPTGDVSHAEIKEIARHAFERKAWESAIDRHISSDTLFLVLERIPSYIDWNNNEKDLEFVVPLLNVGDALPRGRGIKDTSFARASDLIRSWLTDVALSDLTLLALAVQESHAVVLPTYVTSWATYRVRQAGNSFDESDRQAATSQFEIETLSPKLQQSIECCVGRIRKAAEDQSLLLRRELFELLRVLAEWDDIEYVQRWVSECITDELRLLELLRSFWYQDHRPPEFRGNQLILDLNSFFVDGSLEARIGQLDISSLRLQDQTIVHECRDALQTALAKAREHGD